ncbi:glutamyl-tRNA reductase [[Clostridium] ultunense Esp]|uniref:glutamyl-tRNA reductase n=1 Tax=Thermicanus aegyptius TaxID=94009 RepID=UPI0002B6F59C|nr:glutamyl-tRNA reductase [[Clostridium] ultunense Esp]
MQILVVGLNFKTAPVEIRECIAFRDEETLKAVESLKQKKCILENVILSTCNRTEIYAVVDNLRAGKETTERFLSEWFRIPLTDFQSHLYVYTGSEAIRHLFSVAAGLDSMVLGETQILGQVREAAALSQKVKASGKIFNTLFKQAVTLAKRAHGETQINENPVSVSYAAVVLAKKVFGQFQDKTVLIIGAGKMGELTAKHFTELGSREVIVANRSPDKREKLAALFQAKTITLEEIPVALSKADIVISSTGAPGYILTRDRVEAVMKKRKGHPLFMIDIAVPRDLDPSIHELESVYLYDIDDLQGIVEANLEERKKAAEKIRLMIEEDREAFERWFETLDLIPVIDALRRKALHIQEETMKSIERKIPDLDERERKVLQKHTKSIINQLLKDPIMQLKEMAGEEKSREALLLLTKLFALEEYMEEERNAPADPKSEGEPESSLSFTLLQAGSPVGP